MKADELTHEQIRNLTPEQIEKIEELGEGAEVDEILAGKKKATTDDEQPEQAEQDGATNGEGDEDEDSKDGEETKEDEPIVRNKSGKGEIPYSAHKGLRVENATLKEQLEAAQGKLQEMDKLKALLQEKEEAKGDVKATVEIDTAIANHLEVVKADYPEFHQIFTAVIEGNRKQAAEFRQQAEKLEKKLADLERKEEEAKRAEEKSVAEQVAEAKDNNPYLAHWENNDLDAWNEALNQDQVLRFTAKWAKAPYEERFKEVVRRVQQIMPEASKPKTTKSAETVQAEAKAKLDKAPARKLTTLSDVHGGNPTSEKDALDNLSGAELTARLLNMSPSKQAAMRADFD